MATAALSVLERGSGAASDVSHPLSTHNEDWDAPAQPHLRPRILRHETSQILSYYQSADAGRTEPEHSYPSPNPEPVSHSHSGRHRTETDTRHSRDATIVGPRSASPSSNYSSENSVSDYGSPEAERALKTWEGPGRAAGWNGDKSIEEDGVVGESNLDSMVMDVQYGIALGSPGGDASLLIASSTTAARVETETGIETGPGEDRDGLNTTANGNSRSDDGTCYGIGRIMDQFQLGHRHGAATPAEEGQRANISPPVFHQSSQPQVQSSGMLEPRETKEQTIGGRIVTDDSDLPPLGVSTVDSITDPAFFVFNGAPVPRRKVSSRGASDKRRVAVVEVDGGAERDREGDLSDGFARVEGPGAPPEQQQQQQAPRANFSVQPSISSCSSSSSSHPPSSFSPSGAGSRSTAVSALLARRGIVGNFAFLAPPDASPSAYANLGYFTPPLSAPASAQPTPPLLSRHESSESAASSYSNTTASSGRRQHQRSQSEAILTGAGTSSVTRSIPKQDSDAISSDSTSKGEKRSRPGHRLRKSSRDIGIVGTSTAISPTSGTMTTEVHLRHDESKTRTATSPDGNPVHPAQLSPIFQTPSRSQTSLIPTDGAVEPGSSVYDAQSTPMSKEPKQYFHQHTASGSGQGNGNASFSSSNGTASRSQRDESRSTAAGPDLNYMRHGVSNISSPSVHPYYSSSGLPSPSYSYYSMATTASSSSVSSPPTVLTMPAPAPSPYLYYQPGVHATAGPLPSPPRQIIPPKRDSPPPPRPPRLHAPSSGSSSLAKRRSDTSITAKQEPAFSPAARQPEATAPVMSPSTTSSTLVNSQSDDSVKSKGHTREGAFPMDSVIVSDATHTPARLSVKREQQEQQALKRKNTMEDLVRDVTAAIDGATNQAQKSNPSSSVETSSTAKTEPSPPAPREQSLRERRSGMDLRREESRSTFRGGETRSPDSPSSTYSDDDYDKIADITLTKPLPDLSPQKLERSDSQGSGGLSRPQKMLDLALKRFSALPRPPSRLSANKVSPRSSVSHDRVSQERSDNGASAGHGNGFAPEQQRSTPPRTKVIYVAKIRSRWPDAMNFADVLAKRTSLERSLGYARKINELANYDPGLGDWVTTTKHNLTVPGKGSTKRKSVSPGAVRSPSEHSFVLQPRHSSRGSIGSEMTFPKRVDAYVATDLLPQKSEDGTLPRGPPPLPYPTLAQGPPPVQQSTRLGASASTRSNASSLGSGKSSGGGFFASIGRKTSVKKDRPVISGSQPNKLLSKRQQAIATPAPRPVQINAAPSLPGGPRAPPGRVQRAQSVIAPKALVVESDTELSRRISIKRSPSVAPSFAQSGLSQVAETASDIDAKVAKLADLLPHADKKILAGYLRRAGGMDMVAIGRYLDDEKNGVLIRE